jgi:hypothetical protein
MVVYSKQSYYDQDDGHILKGEQKQQYIMCPAPISFLSDELKSELGMKAKKYEEEVDAKFCSLKVPMDHEDKDSKTYLVKIKKYDTGTPEEFLRWILTSNEQIKNHSYSGNYKMVMNLAHAILAGSGLESFLSERWAQEVKNKTRKANEQTYYISQQVYDCAIFELAIRAFEIQSVWRDAFERQREYTRRYLFIGKINPEKFSNRLQDMNKYLDYIPIETTAGSDKTQKAYGK